MKFGHIGIKVIDLKVSLKFYQEVLECKVLKEYTYPEMTLVFLDGNGTIIELIFRENNKKRSAGPIEHIAFKVENLNDKMAQLDKLNISYSEPKIVGSARIIFIEGPNHEKFEFVERV